MLIKQCPACGSEKITIKEQEKTIQAPYGTIEKYMTRHTECDTCTEQIDVSDENVMLDAMHRSEKKALQVICEDLNDLGFKTSDIAMILNWHPHDVIDKNLTREAPVDSVLFSYMLLIRELPEILEHEKIFKYDLKDCPPKSVE